MTGYRIKSGMADSDYLVAGLLCNIREKIAANNHCRERRVSLIRSLDSLESLHVASEPG